MASDYNKLTNGVKTTTIIIYKEKLKIYNRQYIYCILQILLDNYIKKNKTFGYSYIREQEAAKFNSKKVREKFK